MTDTTLPPASDGDVPIDVEFEPAPQRRKADQIFAAPGWIAFAGLGAVSVLALALAASAVGLVPGLKSGSGDMKALKSEISVLKTDRDLTVEAGTALETKTRNLEADIRAVQADLKRGSDAAAGADRQLGDLNRRFDTFSAGPVLTATVDPETGERILTPVNPFVLERLETLENAITTFPQSEGGVPPASNTLLAEVAALRAELEVLKAAAQALSQDDVQAGAESSLADAALALSAIEAAARRGRPFQSGYQRLITAMPTERTVLALAPLAETGAPTIPELLDEFSALEQAALDADAVSDSATSGWMRSIFGDSVKVRRPGVVNAGDALQAARSALSDGDLGASIREVESLPSPVQSVFIDWLNNARNRQSLEDALQALRLTMIAKDRP